MTTALDSTPFPQDRQIQFRPVRPSDYELIQALFYQQDIAQSRTQGVTPSPESFHQMVWREVLCQFIVEFEPNKVGLVVAYRPDFRHGHCYFSVYGAKVVHGTGRLLLATRLFLDYLFATFGFKKLYAEVSGHDLPQFGGGAGKYFIVEGELSRHFTIGEREYALFVLAVYRDLWERQMNRVDLLRARLGHVPD